MTHDEALVVVALYDFEPSDASSLAFRKGDLVQVLNTLDSGWWDGVILLPADSEANKVLATAAALTAAAQASQSSFTHNGRKYSLPTSSVYDSALSPESIMGARGWFPSNYVAPLFAPVAESPSHDLTQNPTAYSITTMTPQKKTSITSTTRYSPMDSAYDSAHSEVSLLSDKENLLLTLTSFDNLRVEDRPMSANIRAADSRSEAGRPLSIMSRLSQHEHHPLHLDRKYLVSSPSHGPRTPSTATTPSTACSAFSSSTGNSTPITATSTTTVPPAVLIPSNKPSHLWQHHTEPIFKSLRAITETNSTSKFIPLSSHIVESTRMILYASDMAKNDSDVLRRHPELRTAHRSLLMSLAKLVSAAKISATTTNHHTVVHGASHDVMDALQNLVTISVSLRVQLTFSNDSVSFSPLEEPSSPYLTHRLSKLSISSQNSIDVALYDLMHVMEQHTDSVGGTLKELLALIDKDLCDSQRLIGDVRSIVSSMGDFTTIMDEVEALIAGQYPFEDKELKVLKLSLHNAISGLVMATQTAINPLAPPNALEQVVLSFGLIGKINQDINVVARRVVDAEEANRLKRALRRGSEGSIGLKRNEIVSPIIGRGRSATVPTDGLTRIEEGRESKRESEARLRYDTQDHPDSTTSILFSSDGIVKAGTLVSLIERLTTHDSLDSTFTSTFFLTFETFVSPDGLLNALIERYDAQPPNNQDPIDWAERVQDLIHLRVLNTLKTWVEFYLPSTPGPRPEDPEKFSQKHLEVLTRMKSLLGTLSHPAAFAVIKTIERRENGASIRRPSMTGPLNINRANNPSPILPKSLRRIKFLDVDPLEIARQLTIMEYELFSKVQSHELLQKEWNNPSGAEGGVRRMIDFSNSVTYWVASAILFEKDVKKRCNVIKHFILIADKCRGLNNFNTLMSILAGLNSAPIHRLKRTWDLVSTKALGYLESIDKFVNSSKNFSTYRETLVSILPPAIPFLGVYLTDLTFIEDGNADMTQSHSTNSQSSWTSRTPLINFNKRTKTADIIREVRRFQGTSYALTEIAEIREYLRLSVEEIYNGKEKDLYDLSLDVEPREREDEKIARLLHESGFL